jgi:hypothetical protein
VAFRDRSCCRYRQIEGYCSRRRSKIHQIKCDLTSPRGTYIMMLGRIHGITVQLMRNRCTTWRDVWWYRLSKPRGDLNVGRFHLQHDSLRGANRYVLLLVGSYLLALLRLVRLVWCRSSIGGVLGFGGCFGMMQRSRPRWVVVQVTQNIHFFLRFMDRHAGQRHLLGAAVRASRPRD